MDVLNGLDTFIVLALKGSVASASRELGVPRSTVSRRLSRLEDELGVTLFERNSRNLRLTDAGLELLERGRPLVADLRALHSDVRDMRGEVQGTLRVSAPVGLGTDFLAEFLRQLRARAPRLRPELLIRDGIPDLLAENVDIAFCEGPLDDSQWYVHLVSESEHAVVVSEAYVERHGEPTTPDELENHECLGLGWGQAGATRWPLRSGGSIEIAPVLRSNDMQLLRQAVLAGLGVALLPTYAVALDLLEGKLRVILPQIGRSSNLYTLTTRKRTESNKLDVFFSLLDDFTDSVDQTMTPSE